MNGYSAVRFFLDYVATWPTVLAFGPFVLVWAGWIGRRMALRILRDLKEPLP